MTSTEIAVKALKREMTPEELALHIVELASGVNSAEEPYDVVCNGCVNVMLKARRVFTDAANYGISGAQAAMIGIEVAHKMGSTD